MAQAVGMVMTQRKGAKRIRCIHGFDRQIRWRISGMTIMVAPHQRDGQRGMSPAPGTKRGHDRIGLRCTRMQQVAQDHQTFGRTRLDQARQPIQRGAGRP